MSSASFTASNSISVALSLPSAIQGLSSTLPFALVIPSFIFTYSTLGFPAVVSSLPSSTCTAFPPLMIGGSSGGTSVFSSRPPTLGKAFLIGPGYSPIPYKLVAKITGGQFIELADHLSDNIKAQDVKPQAYLEGKLLVTGTMKQAMEITDIVTWIEAFSIFCLVLCHLFPSCWTDLSQYKLLIIQTAKRFHYKSWLHYDIAFMKEAAASGSTDWSCMEADLCNFHTKSPSASSSSEALSSSGNASSSQYCHLWNDWLCCWPFGGCRLRHSCESCNGDHPNIRCPHSPPRRVWSRSPSQPKGVTPTPDCLSPATPVHSFSSFPLVDVCSLQLRSLPVPVPVSSLVGQSQQFPHHPVSLSSEVSTPTPPVACPLKPAPQITPIAVDRLQFELRNYPHPDKAAYVMQGLRHSFHLGFNDNISLKSAAGNMASVLANPQVIDNCNLHTEVQLGRVAGPFLQPPFHSLHVSRFAAIPKHNQPGK